MVRKFIYGPGIDEPICMIDVSDNNKKYYYHFDGLGSVVALSDVNGVIVETYSYDVFGDPNRTSSVGNPYMFTGRRYDDEAGLYYYRARYYKPAIGRFLQTDPIGYFAGLNLYTYCGNNPLNWFDPWGLCEEESKERSPVGELLDIISDAEKWNRTKNVGWRPWNQCNKQAGHLAEYIRRSNPKYWSPFPEWKAKRRTLFPHFGFPGNHTVVGVSPTVFARRQGFNTTYYIDPYRGVFRTLRGNRKLNLRIGFINDFYKKYPYKQGQSIFP